MFERGVGWTTGGRRVGVARVKGEGEGENKKHRYNEKGDAGKKRGTKRRREPTIGRLAGRQAG